MSRGKKILTVPPGGEEASWQAVLDDYLAFLRGSGRSKSTVELYRDQVSRFYGARGAPWDREREDFLAWNGEPQIHTNHRLDACRRFWAWALGEGYRKTNPASGIPRRLTNKNPVANVDLDDIGKLARAFRDELRDCPNRWEALRNYAYLLFALGTGVRPGEGLRLCRCDFNLRERHAVVRGEFVKTRQSRVIYIPRNRELDALLRKMIGIQVGLGFSGETPLFCDSAGNALNTRSWCHIVKKRAARIDVRVKPYDLRHAFITHSLISGANPYDLRDQVGHANMEMMKRYYHSNAEVRRNTADLAPLRKILPS